MSDNNKIRSPRKHLLARRTLSRPGYPRLNVRGPSSPASAGIAEPVKPIGFADIVAKVKSAVISVLVKIEQATTSTTKHDQEANDPFSDALTCRALLLASRLARHTAPRIRDVVRLARAAGKRAVLMRMRSGNEIKLVALPLGHA